MFCGRKTGFEKFPVRRTDPKIRAEVGVIRFSAVTPIGALLGKRFSFFFFLIGERGGTHRPNESRKKRGERMLFSLPYVSFEKSCVRAVDIFFAVLVTLMVV